MSLNKILHTFKSNRHLKYGLPFIVLVVGGSFGLKEFSSLRFEFRKTQMIDPKDVEKLGIKMKKPGEVTLETEYEKIKKIDIENWENVRGPRLWDETPVDYKQN